jgi:two-component system nitrogen regulation sensor histidine kinase NtrY
MVSEASPGAVRAQSGIAFGLQLAIRLAALLLVLLLAAWALTAGKIFVLLMAALGAAASVAELAQFVARRERTWQQIIAGWAAGERMAVPRQADAAAARAVDAVNQALYERRAPLLSRVQTLEALVDHSPAALFRVGPAPGTLGPASEISEVIELPSVSAVSAVSGMCEARQACEPLNRAARRLLSTIGGADGHGGAGRALAAIAAASAAAGSRAMAGRSTVSLGAPPQRFALATTVLVTPQGESRIVALQDVQDALDQAQATAWRDLARVLSHEIMNSLAPIISLAESAARDLKCNGAAGTPIAAVDALARRARDLSRFVQAYRAIANPLTPRQQTIALQPWLDENLLAWQAQWGTALRWHGAIEPASLAVWADAALLQQAVGAIVVNAAQAAIANGSHRRPDGDTVEDGGVDRVGVGAHVTVRAQSQADGWVIIAVEDSGTGIAAELRDHVFIPFFTTKHDGSGIGLSLARQIVMAHGGRISIEATGQGARIVLALPPAPRQGDGPAVTAA